MAISCCKLRCRVYKHRFRPRAGFEASIRLIICLTERADAYLPSLLPLLCPSFVTVADFSSADDISSTDTWSVSFGLDLMLYIIQSQGHGAVSTASQTEVPSCCRKGGLLPNIALELPAPLKTVSRRGRMTARSCRAQLRSALKTFVVRVPRVPYYETEEVSIDTWTPRWTAPPKPSLPCPAISKLVV